MTATKTHEIAAALLAAGWLAVAGCRSRAAPPAPPAPPPAAPAATPAPAAASPAAVRSVVIEADGQQLYRITQRGEAVTVAGKDDQPLLSATADAGGKRIYRRPDGAGIAEVKSKGEAADGDGGGFKLRTLDGKLLWKVKVGAEKIKISSDDAASRPFVLSLKHAEKIKVHDGDGRELGRVTFRGPEWGVVVSNADGRAVAGTHDDLRSALFGVLLIDAIGPMEKPILMAELLARGL
jgi:hypothetical protein